MVVFSIRNGFGLDVESVDSMPVWGWEGEGSDPETDMPSTFVFDGMVFNLPLCKVMWGKVYSMEE